MSQAESSRRHYLKNREARLRDNRNRKNVTRKFARDYKLSNPCIRCGESEPCCLDFHHRDPTQKKALVTRLASSGCITRLKEEIAKCDILCANCHRKEHYGVIA